MKIFKIVVLGLDFNSPNFGCAALGYSFLNILEQVAKCNNVFFEITSVNYHTFEKKIFGIYSIKDMQVHYKSIKFYRQYMNEIKKANFVFDFTGGDSFTDIYGRIRFIKESLLKQITLLNKVKLILGPQTIGPFSNNWMQKWASIIIKKSYRVYVRDNLSEEYVKSLGGNAVFTTDIAFNLLPEENDYNIKKTEKKRIGVNVSALMLNGGYSKSTSFGLKLDYKKFCLLLLQNLENKGYEIYLIAHVLATDNQENDYALCELLKKESPYVILAPRFKSPMEAKAYLAKMDCLISSRMHAAIGAFSMGVPIIAVSYSRKFQGLFNSVQYPYIIDAKIISELEAVYQIMSWLNDYFVMKDKLNSSLKIVKELNKEFIEDMTKLFL